MKIYKYENYDEYLKCQRAANAKKSGNVWAVEKNIKAICDFLLKYGGVSQGICHGTRQGTEQEWFGKHLPGCRTIGTEIGEVSENDTLTIKHDFNVRIKALVGLHNFVYSNSFDHAFDPASTFRVWCEQLSSGGFLILEYDRRQEHTGEISMKYNKTDPVSITGNELISLAPEWFPGIKHIENLQMPVVTQEWRKAIIFQRTK